MNDKSGTSAVGNAAVASSPVSASDAANTNSSTAAPKGAASQGNPAFRMMGLPRFRLPSRNWLIFLSITGSFASAVIYDKYQTRRIREKWCKLVSHISEEHLSANMMPRKMTVYLAAAPGDGLRQAREHFHLYVKPALVASAMDWDVIEGRKEGDVRFKTAERIRKKRKRAGEGEPEEEVEDQLTVEGIRKKNGAVEYDGIAGDLVIGRNTWKEYIRGLHEGWLGPVDPPKPPETESTSESNASLHSPGHSSLGDAAVKAAVNSIDPTLSESPSKSLSEESSEDDASPTTEGQPNDEKSEQAKKEEEEEEKPKPRQPPPYIQPSEYSAATASPHLPELIGPSTGVQYPHILGFRNTPIRIYRFLNRRRLADSIGQQVAAAVLGSYRPYSSNSLSSDVSAGPGDLEVAKVLDYEERNWWKTTYNPRKEHEESVWIEDMVLDERITSKMREFQLTAEDEDRVKRIREGKEKIGVEGRPEG